MILLSLKANLYIAGFLIVMLLTHFPLLSKWEGWGGGGGEMEKRMMYRSNLEFGSIVFI